MPETPTAPPLSETSTRQSGQDNVMGFIAGRLGSIIPDYPLKNLELYKPRWVWPPGFKHTEQYQRLLTSIQGSGIFHPLLILPDGQVVDGQHRYACAQELGLETVPVRVIDLPLPLRDADQLAIEDWAVYDAIARRHLTRAQATGMLYDLLRGRNEVQAELAKLANLKRGTKKSDVQPDPTHLTVKELAAQAGRSQRSVERAVTVTRHAPPEIQAQLRSGALTLGGAERAMKAARAAGNGTGEVTRTPLQAPATRPPETAIADAAAISHPARAAVAGTAKPVDQLPAPAGSDGERSQVVRVTESFVDGAKALVRKARTWDREALEQLVRALGQIETSLRDGGATAREEHRDD